MSEIGITRRIQVEEIGLVKFSSIFTLLVPDMAVFDGAKVIPLKLFAWLTENEAVQFMYCSWVEVSIVTIIEMGKVEEGFLILLRFRDILLELAEA